uniref:phosphoenolpyruvate carboxykinase (GTP) n=1 Tax=Candidatus Xiphinematobacter sp. Idaho Grape TaxID=1704307 RepID=UPI0011E05927|nr:phosphoenolpyruvate carboxykinase (GTP) [Candidatus Xiphinematobacter sp. Idaho Grape]
MTSISTHFGSTQPTHAAILEWVKKVASLTKPDMIFWCDGTEGEKSYLLSQAVQGGVLHPLNQKKWPGCYYHRSHPNDVARAEQHTFICTENKEEAGPTNNWTEPKKMYQKLYEILQGSMQGRTLFVVPYLMGPPQSTLSKVGIELTDSIYVVLNMRIMTRVGAVAYQQLFHENGFNRGIHSLLDCSLDRRFICHFPTDNAIISVGSGYGGNALLGKKCLALRIGSVLGKKQGWLAEHMLLLCVESPSGEKFYVAAAFPSACGKTNFAMMIPPKALQGWTITTIGDDIAWMHPGSDGRLHAINPETGYFGVIPGTSRQSNPNAMRCIEKDTLFTNVAVTLDGDVWWEGKDGTPPDNLLDWQGNPWDPKSEKKAAHPNGRFTASMYNNPMLAGEVDNPQGVPIDAIIFGGRRATTIPLVFEAFNWIHGVYIGSTVSSEMTAAAFGETGQVRRDPMAMLPFCGYNMGSYFQHWLNIGRRIATPPRIFHVNLFRKDNDGNYLWPGYSENMRILKWVIGRCKNSTGASESPIGWIPSYQDLDWAGLSEVTPEKFDQLMKIDPEEWFHELTSQGELFMKIYPTLPKELIYQRELLIARL